MEIDAQALGSGTRGEGLLDGRLVFRALPGASREEILREFSRRLFEHKVVRDPGELAAKLLERERQGCTGVGAGIAIPHCRLQELSDVVVAMATTAQEVDFLAIDGIPVTLLFLVLSPAQPTAAYLQTLARISRLIRLPGVVQALREADSDAALLRVVREAEAATAVAP